MSMEESKEMRMKKEPISDIKSISETREATITKTREATNMKVSRYKLLIENVLEKIFQAMFSLISV